MTVWLSVLALIPFLLLPIKHAFVWLSLQTLGLGAVLYLGMAGWSMGSGDCRRLGARSRIGGSPGDVCGDWGGVCCEGPGEGCLHSGAVVAGWLWEIERGEAR
jgi:hypothetical protein